MSRLRLICGNAFVSCRIADQSFGIALAGGTANWTARVNAPITTIELDRARVSIERGRPYGEEHGVRQTVRDLGLERIVRRRRPTESEPIGDRSGKLISRTPSSGQIHGQTNRVRVSVPTEVGNESELGQRIRVSYIFARPPISCLNRRLAGYHSGDNSKKKKI